jgi:hypothetical protein
MIKVFENLAYRIVLLARKSGRAEITVTNKEHPLDAPFRKSYDWGQDETWKRDLDTLVGATGAKEVEN